MNQRLLQLQHTLSTHPPRVIYPEGDNPLILAAARQLATQHAVRPILLTAKTEGAAQQEPLAPPELEFIPAEENALTQAAELLRDGAADAMVAGIDHTTADVVRASLKTVGLAPTSQYASSFFVMDVPSFAGGEDGLLLFADCGMNIAPSAEQLAIITQDAAHSAAQLGWQPRIALLSYATKGSAHGPGAELMRRVLELVRSADPTLRIDGELQLDAALSPAIAAKKAPDSPVAGHANVLIFPDLAAGNIAYKLVEQLAGGHAYGPILQGFARPISDLSRGSSLEDIIGASLITASLAHQQASIATRT